MIENKPKILLVDNYDSFTYNLRGLIAAQAPSVTVRVNDDSCLMETDDFTHLVLSPGPKGPEDSGYCPDLVRKWAGRKPILGVCLGLQVIAHVLGGKVIKAPYPTHGKRSLIRHKGGSLFVGIPQQFLAARYHSLIVDKEGLPGAFNIDASYDNMIMALSHKDYPSLFGLQFHPESFLSEGGTRLIENFLKK